METHRTSPTEGNKGEESMDLDMEGPQKNSDEKTDQQQKATQEQQPPIHLEGKEMIQDSQAHIEGSHTIAKEGMGLALNPSFVSPVNYLNIDESVPGPSKHHNIGSPIFHSKNMQIKSIITSIPNIDLNVAYALTNANALREETLLASNLYKLRP